MSDSPSPRPDLDRLKIDRSASRRRQRRSGILPIVVIAVLAAGGWWWWRGRQQDTPVAPPQAQGPRVVSAELWKDLDQSSIAANGYVIARRRAALSTVLSGRLVEIKVEEGTEVNEGDVVARIQYDDYESSLHEAERALATARARLDQARAQTAAQLTRVAEAEAQIAIDRQGIDGARTDLEEARRDRERNETSFARGVINEADWDRICTKVLRLENELDSRKAVLERSERTLAAARADLEALRGGETIAAAEVDRTEILRRSADLLLDKTYVRAPFAGVIVDKGAEQGEVVAATGAGGNSRGSVATLVDFKTLEVQIELPETRLAAIAADNAVEIYLDVEPNRAWRGKVRQIWPRADRGKGTVEIRAVFEERPAMLRPEMAARVIFLSAEAAGDERLVSVPASALKKDAEGDWLFVVVSGKLERRPVELVRRAGDRALLRAGVAAGDQVVDRPDQDFRPGQTFSN